MSSRLTLSDLSPKHQAEVAAQLANGSLLKLGLPKPGTARGGHDGKLADSPLGKLTVEKPVACGSTFKFETTKPIGSEKKRLRQNTKGPNKLEQEFEAWLREEWKGNPLVEIHAQAVTLALANGVKYTADFMVLQPVSGCTGAINYTAFIVCFFETKGFMRDDAAVKIKVAARIYPGFKFHLVTKKKKKEGGGWSIEEVLP